MRTLGLRRACAAVAVLTAGGCSATIQRRAVRPDEGLLQATRGHFDEAEAGFRLSLPRERDHLFRYSDLSLRVIADLRAGRIDSASAIHFFKSIDARDVKTLRAEADQVIARQPQYALPYLWKGIYSIEERRRDALALLDEAIRLDSTFALSYVERGIAYEQLDRHREGLADFTRAIDLDSMMALAYYNRGHSLRVHGDPRAASRDFERLVALRPGLNEGHYFLGLSRYENCDFAAAVEPMTQARSLGMRLPPFLTPEALRSYAAGEFPPPRTQCVAQRRENPSSP